MNCLYDKKSEALSKLFNIQDNFFDYYIRYFEPIEKMRLEFLSEHHKYKYSHLILLIQKILLEESAEEVEKLYYQLLQYSHNNPMIFKNLLTDFEEIYRNLLFNILQYYNSIDYYTHNDNDVKILEYKSIKFYSLIHAIRGSKHLKYEQIDLKKRRNRNSISTTIINHDYLVCYSSDINLEYLPAVPYQIMSFLKTMNNATAFKKTEEIRNLGFNTMLGSSQLHNGNEINLDMDYPLEVSSLICFDKLNPLAYEFAKSQNLPIKLIYTDSYRKAKINIKKI